MYMLVSVNNGTIKPQRSTCVGGNRPLLNQRSIKRNRNFILAHVPACSPTSSETDDFLHIHSQVSRLATA